MSGFLSPLLWAVFSLCFVFIVEVETTLTCLGVNNVVFQELTFYDIYWNVLSGGKNLDFWEIIRRRDLTKNQIQTKLDAFCQHVKGIFLTIQQNSLGHFTQRRIANRQGIQASLLRQRIQYGFDLGRDLQKKQQTCLMQSQATIEEVQASPHANLQAYLNTYCMTKKQAEIAECKFECAGGVNGHCTKYQNIELDLDFDDGVRGGRRRRPSGDGGSDYDDGQSSGGGRRRRPGSGDGNDYDDGQGSGGNGSGKRRRRPGTGSGDDYDDGQGSGGSGKRRRRPKVRVNVGDDDNGNQGAGDNDDGDDGLGDLEIDLPGGRPRRPSDVRQLGDLEHLFRKLLGRLKKPKQQKILLILRNPKLNLKQMKAKLKAYLLDEHDEPFYRHLLLHLTRIAKWQRRQIQRLKVSLDARRFLEDEMNIDLDEDLNREEKCLRKSKLIVRYGNHVAKELNFVSNCHVHEEPKAPQVQIVSGDDEPQTGSDTAGYHISINVE